MIVNMDKRQKIMALTLLATIGAALWLAIQDEAPVATDAVEVVTKQRTAKMPKEQATASSKLPVLASQAQPEDAQDSGVDLFKSMQSRAKEMQQAKTLAPVEPPAPEAPPLPFSYLGSVDENGKTVFFLAKDQRLFTLHVGDQFDGQYRLDQQNNMRLEITYLPLNIKQTLSMTGAS